MKVILLWLETVYDKDGVATHGYSRKMNFNRIDEAREYFRKTLIGIGQSEIVRYGTGARVEVLGKYGTGAKARVEVLGKERKF